MTFLHIALLGMLIVCALAVTLTKNLLSAMIVYMAYSLIMSIIWMLLESPDLAITEAAVGAGITSVLFFVTLKKIHAIKEERDEQAQK
ncbi:MAG: hydrogenase subunit MbhD domain-containing protein [Christensenellales bacterium]